MTFLKLKPNTRINLSIQCIGLLTGTVTHLLWVIQNGFLSEKYNAPVLSRFFWDSLTFLDPLAALLLILKPKAGIWLTVVIIVADVLHNGSFCFRALLAGNEPFGDWVVHNWMFWCQFFFGAFVLFSMKGNLKAVDQVKENGRRLPE